MAKKEFSSSGIKAKVKSRPLSAASSKLKVSSLPQATKVLAPRWEAVSTKSCTDRNGVTRAASPAMLNSAKSPESSVWSFSNLSKGRPFWSRM